MLAEFKIFNQGLSDDTTINEFGLPKWLQQMTADYCQCDSHCISNCECEENIETIENIAVQA